MVKTQAKKTRRKNRKQGGWKVTTGMHYREKKQISAVSHVAQLNVCLDIMPTAGTDSERKRFISRIVAHLGQALKRRGRKHVGITVYEKTKAVDVHGHHICRIEKQDLDILKKYDGVVVYSEVFDWRRRAEKVAYITKQCLPLSPDYQKNCPDRRMAGAPMRGRRVSYTKEAERLIAPEPQPVAWKDMPKSTVIHDGVTA